MGEIRWIRTGILESSCNFNFNNFPYDKQTCSLKLKLSNEYRDYLNLISIDNKINFTHYDDNNQWNLGNYHLDEKEKNNIVYKFNIKRIPKYYEINIIFPIFVIASLCVWNTFIPITLG